MTLSLSHVLDLIERWQQAQARLKRALADTEGRGGSPIESAQEHAMDLDAFVEALDIHSLRAQLEQHASHLREVADEANVPVGRLLVGAADFLAAPRKD